MDENIRLRGFVGKTSPEVITTEGKRSLKDERIRAITQHMWVI